MTEVLYEISDGMALVNCGRGLLLRTPDGEYGPGETTGDGRTAAKIVTDWLAGPRCRAELALPPPAWHAARTSTRTRRAIRPRHTCRGS